MDMNNSIVVASGESGGWREVEEGVGDKWWWKETWLGVVSTQYGVQVMCCRTVHLEPESYIILFTNVIPINSMKVEKLYFQKTSS